MRKIHLLAPLAAALLGACQSTPPTVTGPDRFAEADVNKDENLSRAEMSDYIVAEIFVTRDADKNGVMTAAEWNPENDAEVAKAFKLRDADKDGSVSLIEAKAYARKSAAHDEVFRDADTNKDKGLTREEVRAYYASKEGPMH